jgi:hypothetical protein
MNKRIESNDGAMEAVACCGIDLQSVLPNFLHPLETTEYRKDLYRTITQHSQPRGKWKLFKATWFKFFKLFAIPDWHSFSQVSTGKKKGQLEVHHLVYSTPKRTATSRRTIMI